MTQLVGDRSRCSVEWLLRRLHPLLDVDPSGANKRDQPALRKAEQEKSLVDEPGSAGSGDRTDGEARIVDGLSQPIELHGRFVDLDNRAADLDRAYVDPFDSLECFADGLNTVPATHSIDANVDGLSIHVLHF
jgi:hypothetical protein